MHWIWMLLVFLLGGVSFHVVANGNGQPMWINVGAAAMVFLGLLVVGKSDE